MKKSAIFFVLALCLLAAAQPLEYQLSIEPGGESDTSPMTDRDFDELFANYCGSVERASTQIPYPNYENVLVKKATQKLNTVAPVSFYMYGAVISSYGFRKGRDPEFPWDIYQEILSNPRNQQFGDKKNWETGESSFDEDYLKQKFDYEYYSRDSRPPQSITLGGESFSVKGNSHAFLTYLCGEFRDRPTLIEEKLNWIDNMIKLPAVAQEPIDAGALSASGNSVWQFVTAESYAHYVAFSRKAFQVKEDKAWGLQQQDRLMKLSEKWQVDKPVPAFTVCEVKYIFTEYVTKPNVEDKQFPGYQAYMDGLAAYRDSYCTADDTDYYYDFRGDSNMKPNSPESNGMIWHATSIMNRCKRDADGSVSVAKDRNSGKVLDFTVDACSEYMSKPFSSRWNAARAGLVTWTLYNEKFDPEFSDTKTLISIVPSLTPENQPASFKMHGEELYKGSNPSNFMDRYAENIPGNWLAPDAGFNHVFGIRPEGVEFIDLAYERIKGAVDRHTDWYASGYDDTNFEPERSRVIGQAYSPFVASSYEMSESDAFTAPGVTVNGPVDGRRQWMFVFKVHKDKWYNTESLQAGVPVNFETHWFDETSFGTTHLADTERAWDRLGTPLEGEMESILYLHNIKNEGRAIKDIYSAEEFPEVVVDGFEQTH